MDQVMAEHQHYDEARETAMAWIEKTTQRLLQCSDTSGDQAMLRQKLQGVQVSAERTIKLKM